MGASSVVVAIQARMGSSRLPGKVMMDLCGRPLLERVLEAVEGPWRRIVLTSTSSADNPLAAWCRERGIEVQRGPLEDVLARYASVAEKLKPSCLVRVCADAPFLEASWVAAAARLLEPVFIPGALHAGSWEVWEEANRSPEPEDWLHAGYYWFEKNVRHLHRVPPGYFTVNTQEDLDRARELFRHRSNRTPNA